MVFFEAKFCGKIKPRKFRKVSMITYVKFNLNFLTLCLSKSYWTMPLADNARTKRNEKTFSE